MIINLTIMCCLILHLKIMYFKCNILHFHFYKYQLQIRDIQGSIEITLKYILAYQKCLSVNVSVHFKHISNKLNDM